MAIIKKYEKTVGDPFQKIFIVITTAGHRCCLYRI